MNKFTRYAMTMAAIALVLVAVLAVSMVGTQFATAAPAQQEIPAASRALNAPTGGTLFSGVVSTATGATTRGSVFEVTPYDSAELQLVVDQTVVEGAPNTTTIALEYSNDRINWSSQSIAAAVDADTNAWSTPTITGRYARVLVTPTNVNPVTVTVAAVLKPSYASPVNVTVLTVTTPAE